MITRFFCLLVTGLLVVSSAQAEVYRWVDERGKVHFGDRPMGGGEGAQRFEIQESEPSTNGIDQEGIESKELQEKRLLDAYREERAAKRQARQEMEATKQERSKTCAYARSQLREYNSSRLYEQLEEGGRRYLDDNERQREIEQMEAAVDYWCDS